MSKKGPIMPLKKRVRTNFRSLLRQLAQKEGKSRIPTTYIAHQLPASYTQATKWRKDLLERIHLDTIEKSIRFFQRHEMNVSFEDLFVWSPD